MISCGINRSSLPASTSVSPATVTKKIRSFQFHHRKSHTISLRHTHTCTHAHTRTRVVVNRLRLQERALEMFEIDAQKAIELLADYPDKIPVANVLKQLESKPK